MKGEREYRELEGEMQRHRPVKAEKFQAVRDAARPATGSGSVGRGRIWPRLAAAGAVLALLAACGHQPGPRSGQVVDRLPAGEIQLPAGPVRLSLDEIARLAADGQGSEAIIARLQATRTRHRLSASDVLSLKSRGVPLAVIDHLLDGERRSQHDDCAEQINQRETDRRQALEQAEAACRQRCSQSCPPYGGWPYYRPSYGRPWF